LTSTKRIISLSDNLASFKSRRLVFDTFVPTEVVRNAGCEPVSLDDVLAQCDIVTLHCPSTPQTKKLLNATSIARMKPGSVVINLARGDLIDTAALVAALQSGHLGRGKRGRGKGGRRY
jgi:D-3-phosphoglycerate dehydrogenase